MRLQSIGGRIAMPEVSQDVQQPFRSAQPATPMPQDDLAGALLAAQQHAQVPANSFQSTFLGPVAEFYHNKRQNALDEKAVMAQQSAAQAQAMQQADAVYKAFRQAGADDNTARAYAQGVMTGKLDADKVFAELTKDRSYSLSPGQQRRGADNQLLAENERDPTTTRIQVGGEDQYGPVEKGFRRTWPNGPGGAPVDVPIEGSPAARDIAAQEEMDAQRTQTEAIRAASVINEIDKAIDATNYFSAGVASYMEDARGTPPYELKSLLETVESNVAFDRLTQMRKESKTGGALGQVSNIELGLLKSSLSSLRQGRSPEKLKESLRKVKEHYQAFLAAESGQIPDTYDRSTDPETGKTYIMVNGQWQELEQ